MQWDEEGGHVLHDKSKAYTNPRGQAGSRGPPVARLWVGHQEQDAGMRETRWSPAVSQPGQGLVSKQKNMFFVSQRWQRHTALLQWEDAVWHRNPLGQGWRSGENGRGIVTPAVLTIGLKICLFSHVRVPGEHLLCFQPALALSAPTCAWTPLQPLATPVFLHPSMAPWALSHLLWDNWAAGPSLLLCPLSGG